LNAPDRKGLLKVGYTTRKVAERVKEQLQTSGLKYKIVLEESAWRGDGTAYTDHEVHRALQQAGSYLMATLTQTSIGAVIVFRVPEREVSSIKV